MYIRKNKNSVHEKNVSFNQVGVIFDPLPHYFSSHLKKNDLIDLKFYSKILFINCGQFRIVDAVLNELLGVQAASLRSRVVEAESCYFG